MSCKLSKRKYSETFEQQDRFPDSCGANTNAFHFPQPNNNNNNVHQPQQQPPQSFSYVKNKRRRMFLSQQEKDNKMDIEKYSGDVYSQYFPKPQSMGLRTTVEHASTANPVKRDRNVNLYTEEQVKKLLEMREREIRIQYDRILQEKLQEQFINFTRFNQDYISRQFRAKNFDNSYIS